MKNDLINRIKLGDYDNCYLKTNEIIAKNNVYVENDLKLSISISDDLNINEYWTIDFNGVSQYDNLIGLAYMPYFRIDLEDNHPLLWDYIYDSVECELSGLEGLKSNLINELIGEIARCYDENTYGFIKLESNPLLRQIRTKNGNLLFSTNQKIIEITEGIFNKYNVIFLKKQIKTGKLKGWAFKPNAKVMLFRNPHISSTKTVLGQTYIVADEIRINLNNEA